MIKKRILLLKPYQSVRDLVDAPPLGLLYLTSALRRRFGEAVDVNVIDLKLLRLRPSWLTEHLDELRPDVVGVSALNCEADASQEIAMLAKAWRPETLVVLGGPYSHNRGEEILSSSDFDWTFNGEADYGFPEALDRHFNDKPLDSDIPGLCYKLDSSAPLAADVIPVVSRSGATPSHELGFETPGLHIATSQDAIKDLDALGMPAWDLIDFDQYAGRNNMMGVLKGKRYACLFTSRGCPYLCNYCHDLFGKRFVHRSAEHVLEEIELLYTQYGVDEFQVFDDIFNLHKPRLKKIMGEVYRRWPGKIHFCFPNGVRADIMDEEVVEALYKGGTYAMSIAIETASERLQTMVDKHLKIDRAKETIRLADERGIITRGFFMLGFPTETEEELKATIDFAVNSRLTTALFFTVTPQPETPLYEIAKLVDPEALAAAERNERMGESYRADLPWYQRAYGFKLSRMVQLGYLRFYLRPRRLWNIFRRVPMSNIYQGVYRQVAYGFGFKQEVQRPEALG